jgi:hypothetical protein
VAYHEVWERLPESVGPAWALRLSAEGAAATAATTAAACASPPRLAFLLVSGDYFMFVADRPADAPPLPPVSSDDALCASRLATALDALPHVAHKRLALAFEASFGRLASARAAGDDGADVAPAWRIQLSTLPGRVGAALLPAGTPTTCDELLAVIAAAPGGTLAAGEFSPPGGWAAKRDV